MGNEKLVLSKLDNTLGPYYRFESGTSMAAADVSGVLALMEDFFTNHSTLTNPSPALLKAMLINGARPTGAYNLQVNNAINYEGWGLINLPNSLPTNNPASFNGSTPSSLFIQDQSPTNALATGDSHTFHVTVSSNTEPLRVTLAWTDPPGNPAAAIKLVNSLELIVTNLDDPTNPVVYYGNDIPAGDIFNTAEGPTNTRRFSIPSTTSKTSSSRRYWAQITPSPSLAIASTSTPSPRRRMTSAGIYAPNVVQDYALVISQRQRRGAERVDGHRQRSSFPIRLPTSKITFVTATNQPLLNQFVGANTPLMGTNTFIADEFNTIWGDELAGHHRHDEPVAFLRGDKQCREPTGPSSMHQRRVRHIPAATHFPSRAWACLPIPRPMPRGRRRTLTFM